MLPTGSRVGSQNIGWAWAYGYGEEQLEEEREINANSIMCRAHFGASEDT